MLNINEYGGLVELSDSCKVDRYDKNSTVCKP